MKDFFQKIGLVFFLTFSMWSFAAAQYRPSKAVHPSRVDNMVLHYGYSVGFGIFDTRILNSRHGGVFAYLAEQVSFSPALRLGVIGEWNITDYASLRTIPGIYLGKRSITYTRNDFSDRPQLEELNPNKGLPLTVDAEMSSIYTELPILFKYRGIRINNYNYYLLAGASARMDFAFHNKIRPDKNQIIRTNSCDFAIEFGGGMDFYLRYFRLGVELRMSIGLVDVLNHELVSDMPNYHKYTESIKSLKNTIVTLAFNFE